MLTKWWRSLQVTIRVTTFFKSKQIFCSLKYLKNMQLKLVTFLIFIGNIGYVIYKNLNIYYFDFASVYYKSSFNFVIYYNTNKIPLYKYLNI